MNKAGGGVERHALNKMIIISYNCIIVVAVVFLLGALAGAWLDRHFVNMSRLRDYEHKDFIERRYSRPPMQRTKKFEGDNK